MSDSEKKKRIKKIIDKIVKQTATPTHLYHNKYQLKYSNITYEGEIAQSAIGYKPHGYGEFKYKYRDDNDNKVVVKFAGFFYNGVIHGEGTMIFPDEEWSGTWENGKLTYPTHILKRR